MAAAVTVGAAAGSSLSTGVSSLTPAQRQAVNNSVGFEVERKLPQQLAASLGPNTQLSVGQIAALSGALKLAVRAQLGQQLGISSNVGAAGGTAPSGGQTLASSVGTKSAAKPGKAPTGALNVSAGLKFSIGAQLQAALGTIVDAGLLGAGIQPTARNQVGSELKPALNSALNDSLQSAFGPSPGYPHASGVLVLGTEITMHAEGPWYANVDIDLPDDKDIPTGPFVHEFEGVEFRGTVEPARSGRFGGRCHLKVVGGAGGLATELQVRNYSGGVTRIRTVVDDILRDSGETLSEESDQALLDTQINGWHRTAGPGGRQLTALLSRYGATWRVLRDGTVWVGTDGWPEVEPNGTVIDVHNGDGIVTSAPDVPDSVPGIVVRGHRIVQVVHRLDERGLRTEHHAKSVQTAMSRFLEPVRTEIDYSRRYPCEVVTQNADGTVQVMPDDAAIKGRGLDRCTIYVGLPGTVVKVPHGARCLVAFAAGDPSRPYIDGWAMGTDFESIDIG